MIFKIYVGIKFSFRHSQVNWICYCFLPLNLQSCLSHEYLLKINETHIWYWKIQTARKKMPSEALVRTKAVNIPALKKWHEVRLILPDCPTRSRTIQHQCIPVLWPLAESMESAKDLNPGRFENSPHSSWTVLPLFPFSLLCHWIPALYFVSSEGFIPLSFLCLLLLYPDSTTFKSWITVACVTNKTFPQSSCFVNLKLKLYYVVIANFNKVLPVPNML